MFAVVLTVADTLTFPTDASIHLPLPHAITPQGTGVGAPCQALLLWHPQGGCGGGAASPQSQEQWLLLPSPLPHPSTCWSRGGCVDGLLVTFWFVVEICGGLVSFWLGVSYWLRNTKFPWVLLIYTVEYSVDTMSQNTVPLLQDWSDLARGEHSVYAFSALTQYQVPEASTFNLLGDDKTSAGKEVCNLPTVCCWSQETSSHSLI